MISTTRREFLSSLGIACLASSGYTFSSKGRTPLLSFSTLGCPDWDLKTIIDFAARNHYKGIELRGLLMEMDLTKCPEFNTEENIRTSMSMMNNAKLKFVNLGASTNLHIPQGDNRQKQIDEGKRFIDLAQKLMCPYVRVFPNRLPKNQDRDFTFDLIVQGLMELGNYAKGSKVKILMETHGDVVYANDIERIMINAEHPNVGLIWDPLNMWTITKESPAMVYDKLKQYIRHTHIKNAVLVGDDIKYVLLKEGQVPIFEAIDLLKNDNYNGFYSFEWEKRWHPEIESPEIAIADYSKVMMKYFAMKKRSTLNKFDKHND